jgi:hypothetical protein
MTRAYNTATTQQNSGGAVPPVTAGKNFVLNGGMDIWQRTTSQTDGNNNYIADRWLCSQAPQVTFSRQATGDTTNLPFIQYCMRLQRASGGTQTNAMNIAQSFESVNSIPLAGKTVTLSFYARKGANFSQPSSSLTVQLITGTGTDQNAYTAGYTGSVTAINQSAVLTTTWQRFSYTATLATNITEVAVLVIGGVSGTAGAADYYEITGIQLEAGSVATPFSRNAGTIQGELAACRRYFQVSQFGVGKANGTTTALVQVVWNNMRIAPSYSIPSLNSILLEIGVAYRTPTSSSLNSITANVANGCSEIYFQGASGMTTGNLVNIGGDSIQFSAEL